MVQTLIPRMAKSLAIGRVIDAIAPSYAFMLITIIKEAAPLEAAYAT